jgi:hypothetical protein
MPFDSIALSPLKKLFFEQALTLGEVAVRFLPGMPGIEIPDFLDPQSVQAFVYGLNQPIPIPDLTLTAEGIRGTLSIGRRPYMTFVPWTAVVAMGGVDFGIVFPVAEAQLAAELASKEEAAETAPSVPTGRPTLRLV